MNGTSEPVRLVNKLLHTDKDNLGALRVLEPYLQDHPRDTEALNLLGRACFEEKRFSDAKSAYMRMWSQHPNDVRALFGMGVSLQRLGQLDEAEGWLTATLAVDPGFERAAKRLSQVRSARDNAWANIGPERNISPEGAEHPPRARRPLNKVMIPENPEEIEAYRRGARDVARIDMMNQYWHGIPWPVRALQLLIPWRF